MFGNRHLTLLRAAAAVLTLAAVAAWPTNARAAATITIVNGDPAGVGFNDATAVAPVGGNAGHDSRPAAPQRLPGRGEQVGRHAHESVRPFGCSPRGRP